MIEEEPKMFPETIFFKYGERVKGQHRRQEDVIHRERHVGLNE